MIERPQNQEGMPPQFTVRLSYGMMQVFVKMIQQDLEEERLRGVMAPQGSKAGFVKTLIAAEAARRGYEIVEPNVEALGFARWANKDLSGEAIPDDETSPALSPVSIKEKQQGFRDPKGLSQQNALMAPPPAQPLFEAATIKKAPEETKQQRRRSVSAEMRPIVLQLMEKTGFSQATLQKYFLGDKLTSKTTSSVNNALDAMGLGNLKRHG